MAIDNPATTSNPGGLGAMVVKSGIVGDVTQTHPEYSARLPQWQRMRDVLNGQDAVKEAGATYLPVLNPDVEGDCESEDYKIYLQNAEFYNATSLTYEAFIGMIFRKVPQIGNLSEEDALENDVLKNVDLEGTSIYEFVRRVAGEVNAVGRVGIVFDYPTQEQLDELTINEARESGMRPYIKVYTAESIINWKYQNVNGLTKLVSVVLKEEIEQFPEDPYSHAYEDQYRVLRLENGKYIQEIYNDQGVIVRRMDNIMVNGEHLSELPFVCINPNSIELRSEKPPLLDLADTNLNHYRASGSLGANVYMFGRATPVFKVPHEYWREFRDQTMEFGVTKSIVIPTSKEGGEADAGFMEPKGSIQPIITHMEKLESRMAAQGARMLSAAKKGVEAADTVRMDMSGELSILSSITNMISAGLTKAVSWLLEERTQVKLNSDFMTTPVDAGMITSLLMALQAGNISREQFVDALIRGEAIKQEKDIITDTTFTEPELPDPGLGVPAADGELRGREENVEKGEPLSGPNGREVRGGGAE